MIIIMNGERRKVKATYSRIMWKLDICTYALHNDSSSVLMYRKLQYENYITIQIETSTKMYTLFLIGLN